MLNTAWLRLLCSFMHVAPVLRCTQPAASSAAISPKEATWSGGARISLSCRLTRNRLTRDRLRWDGMMWVWLTWGGWPHHFLCGAHQVDGAGLLHKPDLLLVVCGRAHQRWQHVSKWAEET